MPMLMIAGKARGKAEMLAIVSIQIDRIAFNYLIGNADAHAKNFALLYSELGVARLAPAYDLLSTHVYQHHTHDMAASINGMYDSRGVQPIHRQKEFVRLGLRERLYAARMNELAERVYDALPQAMTWTSEKGIRHHVIASITSLVTRRLLVLRQIRQLASPTARPTRAQPRHDEG
jgi:serine/threonine-protein kinase HipA